MSSDLRTSCPVAIGDLQGCHGAFKRLLAKIDTTTASSIWLTGDLVNRGPASLETLRSVIELGDSAKVVLGNHDLHLLAIAAGAHTQKKGDTLDAILNAPDFDDLMDWLRHQPLAHYDDGFLMVHAGVLPEWSVDQTLALAGEVQAQLRGPSWKSFLGNLWGNEPSAWKDTLRGDDRTRVVVNALTRLRFCNAQGQMEFKANGGIDSAPQGYLPWFDIPTRQSAGTPVVFGHWAALGLYLRDDICALDSGCVWGNKLSALRLAPDPAQRTLIQVKCGDRPATSASL